MNDCDLRCKVKHQVLWRYFSVPMAIVLYIFVFAAALSDGDGEQVVLLLPL